MTEGEHLFSLLGADNFIRFKKDADQCPGIRIICDKKGDFLLHRAVVLELLPDCKYLLERGIPATCPGSKGATPLHYASSAGNVPIMRMLLRQAGINHSPINIHGMTPLHVAAGEGHLAIVKMLTAKGADASTQDKFGRLPLHYAVGTNQVAVTKWLVGRNHGQIDQPDAFGQRPIHWAIQFECINVAEWLVCQGVDINKPDIYSRAPMYFFLFSDEAASRTIPKNLRIKMAEGRLTTYRLSPLHRAICYGTIKEVKQCLKKPAILNRRGDLGRTPLHIAAFMRNRDIFQWMRKNGADANIADDYGWTPLKLLSYRLITGEDSIRPPT
jgi:ankyrin repeat protein